MTDKLTLADCYKYPESPLINQLGLKCENLTEFIKAVDGHDLEFILQDDGFKLILRDLSQLTDEEKAQLLENHLNDQGHTILKRSSYSYGNFENRLYELDVKQTDYLRSIRVDIDNFIKSGKAVKQ